MMKMWLMMISRENVNGILCKSPESVKDNKNVQNNAEKSSISIVGKNVSSKTGT